jgi:hypothetical protein
VDLEICGNCGRTIGKLETAHVWKEHIVCATCYPSLSAPTRAAHGASRWVIAISAFIIALMAILGVSLWAWSTSVRGQTGMSTQASTLLPLAAAPATLPAKAKSKVPAGNDEITLSLLIADPRQFLDKPITMSGEITISNYYNYNYRDAEAVCYSLKFRPESQRSDRQGTSLSVYAERGKYKPLFFWIIKSVKRDPTIVRLSLVLTDAAFNRGFFTEMLEVQDWATVNADGSGWDKWQMSGTDGNSAPRQ